MRVIIALSLAVSPALSGTCPVTPSPFWKNAIVFPDEPFRVEGTSDANPDWVKFTILLCDPTTIYFQNSVQYPFHYDFATENLDPFIGLSPSEFDQVTLQTEGQQAVLGAVLIPYSGGPSLPEYGIQLIGQEPYDPQLVVDLFQAVRDSISAEPGVRAFYFPTFEQSQSALDNLAFLASQGIEVSSVSRWAEGNACYSDGWALGPLKFFPADQVQSAYLAGTLEPSDILLTDGVPAEVPFVAGLISLAPSTPNSHVAILANTFGVPFVHLALPDDAELAWQLTGNRIVLRSETDPGGLSIGCRVRLINLEGELTEHQFQEILALKQLPPLDLSPVAMLGALSAPVAPLLPSDIGSFGGKAAHFGILRQSIPGNSPIAAAFSFDLWSAFLDQTLQAGGTLREEIASRLSGYAYPPDFASLSADLVGIRALFTDEQLTSFSPALHDAVIGALQDPQYGFDPLKKLRFRSSTNVEDSDQFTGAGLYDSKSGCLADDLDGDAAGPGLCDPTENNEKGVFRAIRKVFASFYNDGAFFERLRWGVDEADVGMALLVHHSFPDEIELANGVATLNRKSNGLSEIVMVTQTGAVSVANPETGAVAEEVEALVFSDGVIQSILVRKSSLVVLGDTVMVWPGDYDALALLLRDAADRYQAVTGQASFVLDLEYKKVAPGGGALPPGGLVVKQLRKLPQPDTTPSITPFLVNEPIEYCLDQSTAFELSLNNLEIFANHRLKSRWSIQTRSFRMTIQNLATSIFEDVEWTFTDECRVYTLGGAPAIWPQASYLFQDDVPSGPTTTDSWTLDDLGNPRTYSLLTENVGPLLVAPAESPVLTLRDFGRATVDGRLQGCLQLRADYQNLEPAWSCHGICELSQTTIDNGFVCPCPVRREEDVLQERTHSAGGVTVTTSLYWPAEADGFAFLAAFVDWAGLTTIEGLTSQPIVLQAPFSRSYDPERHGFGEDLLLEPRLDPNVPEFLLAELEASGIEQIRTTSNLFFGDSVTLHAPDGSCTIDSTDQAAFEDCFAGADASPEPTPPRTPEACLAMWDDDADADVDCADWAEFLFRWSGPSPPPVFAPCVAPGPPGRLTDPIEVARSPNSPDRLVLSWNPSCAGGAENYAIYEGELGSWYSHLPLDCSDDGADLTEEITAAPGNRYYLVVPINPKEEGSYGTDGVGAERPVAAGACLALQSIAACP